MINLQLLGYIQRYTIEFGIFDGNGQKVVEANIYNTDNTVTTTPMKVADIMYLTEYGSISVPGKRVLEKSLLYIKRLLKEELTKMIIEIFEGKSDEGKIKSSFEIICLKIRDYVKNYMIATITKTNRLGAIINKDKDDNQYFYNLFDLSKYVECKLKIQN